MKNEPIFSHGKICYLEIPAIDIQQSADFYETVFHWKIRRDSEGNLSFDDSTGQVSGMWITGKKPNVRPAIMISIMVDDIKKTLAAIMLKGGKRERWRGLKNEHPGKAYFSDPAGNVFCLYQHGS